MKNKNTTRFMFTLASVLIFAFFPMSARAQVSNERTWKRFETATDTFENFMRTNPLGDKYDSEMNAIRNVKVRSEAEAIIVSNSSGVTLTYTERTIFENSGFTAAIFRLAWGPMQRRYPIEMWKELRERTSDGIREWIRGGDGTGAKHGDIDGDLIWIIENGLAGAGAAKGWGFDITKSYKIGGNAAITCTPNNANRSYVMTITIPLDNYFKNPSFFNIDARYGRLSANLSFHSVISSILKTSRLFSSDTFIMTEQ